MRYAIPSQVRPATHSIAASALKTCQRVIPSMNGSCGPLVNENYCPETKRPQSEIRLHLQPRKGQRTCWDVGYWPIADMPKFAINVAIGDKADIPLCGAYVCF